MAQYTSDTRTIQSLLASTLEKAFKRGAVSDAIYKMRPVLNKLREAGNLITVNGGERLRVQFTYAQDSGGGSYADDEPIDVTRQDTETSAFFNWKQYAQSIVITGKEMRINKGSDTQLFNLLGQRTQNATQKLQADLTTGIFSDGTGNGSKDITGFEAAMETTPGTIAYASVPIANLAWRNQVETSVGSAAVNLLTNMRTLGNSAMAVGGMGPTPGNICWVTTQTIHEAFIALHVPAQRYSPDQTPDFGLQGVPFEGDEVMWDPGLTTTGLMYRLDLNHCGLYVHEDADISESEEGLQKPVNQDTFVSQVFFMGNFLTDNRAKLGKLQGIT